MLEIFLGTSLLIAALGFLLLAWSVRQLATRLIPPTVEVPEEEQLEFVIPPDVQKVIAQESADWAREDLELDIRVMYQKLKDWPKVHAYLMERVGQAPSSEAATGAWSLAAQGFEKQDGNPIAEGF